MCAFVIKLFKPNSVANYELSKMRLRNLTLYRKTWLDISCAIDAICRHEDSLVLEIIYDRRIRRS